MPPAIHLRITGVHPATKKGLISNQNSGSPESELGKIRDGRPGKDRGFGIGK